MSWMVCFNCLFFTDNWGIHFIIILGMCNIHDIKRHNPNNVSSWKDNGSGHRMAACTVFLTKSHIFYIVYFLSDNLCIILYSIYPLIILPFMPHDCLKKTAFPSLSLLKWPYFRWEAMFAVLSFCFIYLWVFLHKWS